MNEEDYKIAYENVMIANKMLEKELDKFRPFTSAYEMKKEIERLNKENTILTQNSQYLVKQKDELEEELERLNNIINKLIDIIVDSLDANFFEKTYNININDFKIWIKGQIKGGD